MVEVKDLMLGFGGHPLAAGLSLKEENLEKFRQELNARSGLTDADFIPKVMIDVILPVDFLTQSFIKQLEILDLSAKEMKSQFLPRAMLGQSVLRLSVKTKTC